MSTHQLALQAGFLVRHNPTKPEGKQFEVLCADTSEVISQGHQTRQNAWQWAYEKVLNGQTALQIANAR